MQLTFILTIGGSDALDEHWPKLCQHWPYLALLRLNRAFFLGSIFSSIIDADSASADAIFFNKYNFLISIIDAESWNYLRQLLKERYCFSFQVRSISNLILHQFPIILTTFVRPEWTRSDSPHKDKDTSFYTDVYSAPVFFCSNAALGYLYADLLTTRISWVFADNARVGSAARRRIFQWSH